MLQNKYFNRSYLVIGKSQSFGIIRDYLFRLAYFQFVQNGLGEIQIEVIWKKKIRLNILNKGETNVKVLWCPHQFIFFFFFFDHQLLSEPSQIIW